ncbi:DUF835 domain-containing protein, partial [[Eubacterium] cellulosolvens]
SDSFRNYLSTTEELSAAPAGGLEKVSAAEPPKPKKVDVEWGGNYFVDEDEPGVSVKLFNDLTSQGVPGLFITRTQPKKAADQWGLTSSNIIWLCSRSGVGYLRPALEKVSHTINEFIKNNSNSVVLLDGVEYIVNNNDFLKTLSLMDSLKELVAMHNSMLILPISSTIFSEKEFALLGKNSVEIPKNSTFELSKVKKEKN